MLITQIKLKTNLSLSFCCILSFDKKNFSTFKLAAVGQKYVREFYEIARSRLLNIKMNNSNFYRRAEVTFLGSDCENCLKY